MNVWEPIGSKWSSLSWVSDFLDAESATGNAHTGRHRHRGMSQNNRRPLTCVEMQQILLDLSTRDPDLTCAKTPRTPHPLCPRPHSPQPQPPPFVLKPADKAGHDYRHRTRLHGSRVLPFHRTLPGIIRHCSRGSHRRATPINPPSTLVTPGTASRAPRPPPQGSLTSADESRETLLDLRHNRRCPGHYDELI